MMLNPFRRLKKAHRRRVFPPARHLRLEPLEVRNLLAVYTVDNTNDSGSGSLRDAINQANAGTYDTIEFNLVAPYTIAPASALPAITHDNVTINGGGTQMMNALLGNTIEHNGRYGVYLANGAEGNGIGVAMKMSSGVGRQSVPIGDFSVQEANTIDQNTSNQIDIDGDHTAYNFISGYNDIIGQQATSIALSATSLETGERAQIRRPEADMSWEAVQAET